MFYARADYDNFLRNLKARRFKLSISRNGITDFKEIGLIAVDSVAIDDLRSENVVQGGSVMGYEFRMVFTVPNMSVFADNQYVIDREDISKGRWYVSLLDIETNWVRLTPIPVAIDAIESDFNGTQYSFQLRTSDLEWIKHKSATAPVVINPIILPNDNAVPATHTQSNPMTFAFRLSNPSLAQSIEDSVAYDILIYSDSARMNLVAQALNKTKAQIIDVAMSQLQVIDVVTALPYTFEHGRIYYCIARCKYLNSNADTLFVFTTQLTAPTFVLPPTSVEYPTFTSLQVTAQRGSLNANANQVEFEWRIGAVVQGIVSVAYDSTGQATGTFPIPNTTNTPDTIFVRARSRNGVVIGEWSDEIQIALTLFRPMPNILSFTVSQSKVALDAQPSSQVFFSIQFSYSDAFSGNCTWKIERVDNLQLILSGVQTSNPHFVSNITVPLPSVTSPTTLTYRLTVTNPNNQSVTSDINIEYLPRPSFLNSEVFFFFNPNYQTYQDVNKIALANQNGHPVGLIEDEIDNTRKVEQQTIVNKPILFASGNRFFLQSNTNGMNLRQPASDNALPTILSERDNFTWIMVSNFPNIAGEICQPMNLSLESTDIILGFWLSNVLFRLGSSVSSDIQLPNTPYNTWNIMQVVVVTYQRNTTNGFKVYSSLYPTSSNRLVGQQNTTNNTLGGSNNDRMMICSSKSTNLTYPRRVGHVISFKKTLSQSEALAWIDWLCSYYQITPAP